MAERFAWTCPFCNHDAMIHPNSPDYYRVSGHIGTTKYGDQMVIAVAIICPNPECQEYTLSAGIWGAVHNQSVGRYQSTGESHRKWQLVPSSEAKVFPDYIPQVILDDYYEACLIKNLSPKASATLSRRCLQGMIRDYWGIAKRRLKDEIGALQEKVDPLMWQAIDAVREIGNIGAHMEHDIDHVIDRNSAQQFSVVVDDRRRQQIALFE